MSSIFRKLILKTEHFKRWHGMAWHAKCARGSHTPQLFFFMHLSHVYLMTRAQLQNYSNWKMEFSHFDWKRNFIGEWARKATSNAIYFCSIVKAQNSTPNRLNWQVQPRVSFFFHCELTKAMNCAWRIAWKALRIFCRFRFHFCKFLSSFSEGLFASLCRAFLFFATIFHYSCLNAQLSSYDDFIYNSVILTAKLVVP